MTRAVRFVHPTNSAEECMALMTENRLRHLPVMDGEQVVGLVSIGDLVKASSPSSSSPSADGAIHHPRLVMPHSPRSPRLRGATTLPGMSQLILGIESSCDETGVALVRAEGGGVPRLLAHALHSQIDMHRPMAAWCRSWPAATISAACCR
jgi:CBS domain-containing protein